jgi:hypothetical protein
MNTGNALLAKAIYATHIYLSIVLLPPASPLLSRTLVTKHITISPCKANFRTPTRVQCYYTALYRLYCSV